MYGTEEQLKPSLWSAVDELKPVKANFENLEVFTDTVRAKTLALKQLGVSDGTLDEYTAILSKKLPLNLQSEMRKMKLILQQVYPNAPQGEASKMDQFLEALVNFQKIGPSSSSAKNADKDQKGGKRSLPPKSSQATVSQFPCPDLDIMSVCQYEVLGNVRKGPRIWNVCMYIVFWSEIKVVLLERGCVLLWSSRIIMG